MIIMRLLAAAVLPVTLACGSDAVVDGGQGASGQGGGSDPSCPESGPCGGESCNTQWDECRWGCVSEYICDAVRFLGQDESTSKPYTLDDPSAATCVLTALRDGTPGTVSWYATGAAVPGQFSHGTRLYIRANRVVLSEWHEYADSPLSADSRGPSVLADATIFTACLTETDPDAIWDCLEGWEDHCGVP